ncbi:MAG: hypothetical protein JSS91_12465 [Bacteroidetes bacterium]|nr:hypothetical protein [Bacteroidota bacterium]
MENKLMIRSVLVIIFSAVLFYSCSSSNYNIKKDIVGIWINEHQGAGNFEHGRTYYQVIFKKDSFFIEMGELNDNTTMDSQPFKAKGLYSIKGDIIDMKGVAKAEGFSNFDVVFEEKFDYAFDMNTMVLFPMGNIIKKRFYLVRRF